VSTTWFATSSSDALDPKAEDAVAEPLIVDTARLRSAGAKLAALVFPAAPGRIATAGADSVSAAVNEAMAVIETPVLDDLPIARAALAKTASAITAAAGMYADTDQSLGRDLAAQEFSSTGLILSEAASPPTQLAAAAADDDGPVDTMPVDEVVPVRPRDVLAAASSVMNSVNETVQPINQMATTVNTTTQSIVQSAQGAAQNQPGQSHEDDDAAEHEDQENPVDGAAAGATLEGVPLQSITESEAGLRPADAPAPSASGR
jgi:ESX secretion-associated protein EspJ